MTALSVVLPVRDGEAFLDQAIASLRAQTFADFELLVVDDGSRDRSDEIAARHAAEDGRIRVLANRGSGLVDALNLGIESSRSALIARMDADDIALPERFARQMERLSGDPELQVLGTAMRRMDGKGEPGDMVTPPTEPADVARALERVNPMAHPTVIMRRAAVEAVGGYRGAYVRAEDYDLWLRLAERGRLANLAEPLLLYRIVPGFRPDVFSRQVRSEMAARAAARLRRSGAPDPTGGWSDIGETELRQIGLGERDVAAETARRALHAARLSRKLGDRQGLRAALRLADSLPKGGLAATARYAVRRLKVFL